MTVSAFLIGSTGAGAAMGLLAGALGSVALGDSVGARPRLLALSGALALAILLDLLPPAVPGPRRQVNERWLDEFRGWVYGLGFGGQLGLGVTTVVSTAATYVAILATFLAGDALRGALVLGLFGAIRGLTPLTTAGVRGPDQLRSLHLRLERTRGAVGPVSVASLIGMTLVAFAAGLA